MVVNIQANLAIHYGTGECRMVSLEYHDWLSIYKANNIVNCNEVISEIRAFPIFEFFIHGMQPNDKK